MKSYLYATIIAIVLSLGFSVAANAQTRSSTSQPDADSYPANRPNYNYLGLLGLLGLYGLHKNRLNAKAGIDRKAL